MRMCGVLPMLCRTLSNFMPVSEVRGSR